MILRYFIAALLLSIVPVLAQEGGDRRRPAGDWGARKTSRKPSERAEQFKRHVEKVLLKLKEKDPKAYEEMVKLRKEDPQAFHKKLRTLMAKHRPDADGEGKDRRGPRDGDERGPEDKDRRPEGDRDRPRKGGHGEGPGRRPFGHRMDERLLDRLKDQDPERWEQIKKLREENPEMAKKMLHEMLGGFRRRYFGRDDKAKLLAEKYHATEDEKEKAKIAEKIAEEVEKSFEKRMADSEKQVKMMLERLEAMKKKIEETRKHKDKICAKRVKFLLSGEKPEGDGRPEGRPGMDREKGGRPRKGPKDGE